MARRWTIAEEQEKYLELHKLYVKENRTLAEVSNFLGLAQATIFQRMMRLGISSTPERKVTYIARKRDDIRIQKKYTKDLAEFFGIMLGDGKLSYYQIVVTLGTKELAYAEYVVGLIEKLFSVKPKIGIRKNGYKDVYLGSVDLTAWLQKEGLVYNKVLAQVDAPQWIFSSSEYINGFLRGFFDTDGSVYKLRFGVQLSFNNKSLPLLNAIYKMLHAVGYHPSKIGGFKIYITKRQDVKRFFEEIQPANIKHVKRFDVIWNRLGQVAS